MKLAYDPQIFLAQKYGGVSRYYCEITSRIAKEAGVNVSIVAPMHINAYSEKTIGYMAERFDVNCYRLGSLHIFSDSKDSKMENSSYATE